MSRLSTRLLTLIILLLPVPALTQTVFTDNFSSSRNRSFWDRYEIRGGCERCFDLRGDKLIVTDRAYRAELSPTDRDAQPAYNTEMEWEFDVRFTELNHRGSKIFWQVNTEPWNGLDMSLTVGKENRLKAFVRKGVGASGRYKRREFIGTGSDGKGSVVEGRRYRFKVRFRRHLRRGLFMVWVDGNLRWRYEEGATTQSSSSKSKTKFGLYGGPRRQGGFEAEFERIKVTRRR